ncbi:MAG TPA: response regulator transcription factor [Tepidisphaeraceae bacterium]|nr:response regulator transcription factor [Tepidisphaeraceae bacterium]
MPSKVPIRFVLADDHQMMRAGLRSILEQRPGYQVVGEAEDGRRTVEIVRETSPHIVLMDITMPDLNGIEATRQIMSISPGTKVIGLSMHSDRQMITEILRAGASGYLLKNSAASELLIAVESVMIGKSYLSPDVTRVVMDEMLGKNAPASEPSAFTSLTTREREVLQLIAEGKTNKEIARSLEIGIKTVETYRGQVMDKLNLRSVAELTKYAIRNGLTSLQ